MPIQPRDRNLPGVAQSIPIDAHMPLRLPLPPEQDSDEPACPAAPSRGRPARAALTVVLLGAAVAGCAHVLVQRPGENPEFMRRSEFKRYTEGVFRHHNQVHGLMLLVLPDLEEGEPDQFGRLRVRERKMLSACDELNEAVLMQRKGERPGFFGRLLMPMRVTDCDRETRHSERLMQRLGLLPEGFRPPGDTPM